MRGRVKLHRTNDSPNSSEEILAGEKMHETKYHLQPQ